MYVFRTNFCYLELSFDSLIIDLDYNYILFLSLVFDYVFMTFEYLVFVLILA